MFKILLFLFHQPHLASTTSERKCTKYFTGCGCGAPMIMPRPCLSSSKELSIRAFIKGIVCFCTRVGSFRILKKAGEWRLQSLFLFVIEAKIRQKTRWIFQICKNCDPEKMKIGKLSISYQISPPQDSKNDYLLVRMSFNHEKMFVWNASIWVRGPCISYFSLYLWPTT